MKLAIKNAGVLPEGHKKTDVFIDGDTIAAIGKEPEGFAPDRVVDGENKLLIPGLINAHTHIYMTCMRNRADDLNFTKWLFDTVVPLEETLTDEQAYWGIQLGCMEMLRAAFLHLRYAYVPMTTPAHGGQRHESRVTRGLQGGRTARSKRKTSQSGSRRNERLQALPSLTLSRRARAYTATTGILSISRCWSEQEWAFMSTSPKARTSRTRLIRDTQ
jgi:5-methylthioadenosine/S-adenosylhomocysteine deaminase